MMELGGIAIDKGSLPASTDQTNVTMSEKDFDVSIMIPENATVDVDGEQAIVIGSRAKTSELKPGEVDMSATNAIAGSEIDLGDKKKRHVYLGSITQEGAQRGGLSQKVLVEVIKKRLGGVRSCYERTLRAKEDISGRVDVEVTVSDTGEVSKVDVVEDTVNSPSLTLCIVDKVKVWKFPRPEGGEMKFRYPFTFVQGCKTRKFFLEYLHTKSKTEARRPPFFVGVSLIRLPGGRFAVGGRPVFRLDAEDGRQKLQVGAGQIFITHDQVRIGMLRRGYRRSAACFGGSRRWRPLGRRLLVSLDDKPDGAVHRQKDAIDLDVVVRVGFSSPGSVPSPWGS
ncbi:MAG: AgmX/PglI C-terminal domain-containing protein [Deltaproteobacteria bacterium]|nr:AgmX/PglI C-terminal domain-containing protein [Deltaproteobacteria bacterium]